MEATGNSGWALADQSARTDTIVPLRVANQALVHGAHLAATAGDREGAVAWTAASSSRSRSCSPDDGVSLDLGIDPYTGRPLSYRDGALHIGTGTRGRRSLRARGPG